MLSQDTAANPTFPEGKRFAFTIIDDTDLGTVENLTPIYSLLAELGMLTTKTVWAFDYSDGHSDFLPTDTLERDTFVSFVRGLSAQGFEIAYHGATMESSRRDRTLAGLERFQAVFGHPPQVYANHAYNRENIYWGPDRIDEPLLRWAFARASGTPRTHYRGVDEGSAWFWGDVAREFRYVRNLTFRRINTLACNPSMPYVDPTRPFVRAWFSASDADGVTAFNHLLAPHRQDELERERGVCIVATHLGKGFARDGRVHPETERLLRLLAARDGWFVPVGRLLDWLAADRGLRVLPLAEWRGMQWRWARDLVAQGLWARWVRARGRTAWERMAR